MLNWKCFLYVLISQHLVLSSPNRILATPMWINAGFSEGVSILMLGTVGHAKFWVSWRKYFICKKKKKKKGKRKKKKKIEIELWKNPAFLQKYWTTQFTQSFFFSFFLCLMLCYFNQKTMPSFNCALSFMGFLVFCF